LPGSPRLHAEASARSRPGPLRLWPGLVNVELSAAHIGPVEGRDGRSAAAESVISTNAKPRGRPVSRSVTGSRAPLLHELQTRPNCRFRRREIQIANKYVLHVVSSNLHCNFRLCGLRQATGPRQVSQDDQKALLFYQNPARSVQNTSMTAPNRHLPIALLLLLNTAAMASPNGGPRRPPTTGTASNLAGGSNYIRPPLLTNWRCGRRYIRSGQDQLG